MISTCQGRRHLSLHSPEGFEVRGWNRPLARRLIVCDPFCIGSTHQRDQTSICGNSITPSTKIEFGLTGRPRNRPIGTSGGKTSVVQSYLSEERPAGPCPIVACLHTAGVWGDFPAGAARRTGAPVGTARSSQGRARFWRGGANPRRRGP